MSIKNKAKVSLFSVARGEARVSRWGGLEPRTWRAREREPITAVWRRSPQRGQGAEPLVKGSGGKAPPPEAVNVLTVESQADEQNLSHSAVHTGVNHKAFWESKFQLT